MKIPHALWHGQSKNIIIIYYTIFIVLIYLINNLLFILIHYLECLYYDIKIIIINYSDIFLFIILFLKNNILSIIDKFRTRRFVLVSVWFSEEPLSSPSRADITPCASLLTHHCCVL